MCLMEQDIHLQVGFLQACHSSRLDGIPGDPVPVPVSVAISVLTSPLWEVSTARLSFNMLCGFISMPLSFKFVIQSFAHRFFFLFGPNPYSMSIRASYRNLFLSVIFIHCMPFREPRVLSYLAFLRVLRNMILKHDFLVRVTSLSTAPRISHLWLLGIVFLIFCQQHPSQNRFSAPLTLTQLTYSNQHHPLMMTLADDVLVVVDNTCLALRMLVHILLAPVMLTITAHSNLLTMSILVQTR